MVIISPSVLSADLSSLAEEVKKVEEAGAKYIHLDVMDGAFVPNISFGIPVIKCLRGKTNCVFDLHLMIEEPDRYLEAFKNCGADIVTVHAEACTHLHRTVEHIKALGMKAGVALNPSTPFSTLEYMLGDLDSILIMCVNPGFGGQKFIPSSLKKISDARRLVETSGRKIDIQVDGGVTLDNVKDVVEAGANIIVAGSAIFKGDSFHNMKQFLEAVKMYS